MTQFAEAGFTTRMDADFPNMLQSLEAGSLAPEQLDNMVSAHPYLITKQFLDAHAAQPGLTQAMARLREYAGQLAKRERAWPWGAGPLERIFADLDRAYGLEAAKILACAPEVTRSLSPPYLSAASDLTGHLSATSEPDKAARLHEILLAAVDCPGIDDETNVRRVVWLGWLLVVSRILRLYCDDRAYSLACDIDARLNEMAAATGNALLQAERDWSFAALLSEPWRGLTSLVTSSYSRNPMLRTRWHERGAAMQAASKALPPSRKQRRSFPDAKHALREAEARLRRALNCKLDPDQTKPFIARIQLLLAEVLCFQLQQRTIASSADQRRKEAAALAQQAADSFPPHDQPLRLAALALLTSLGQKAPLDAVPKLPPVDDLCNLFGVHEAGRQVISAAQILVDTDPDRTLSLLGEARYLLRNLAEADRGTATGVYVQALLGGAIALRAAELIDQIDAPVVSAKQVWEAASQRARRDGWRLTELARVLANAACHRKLRAHEALPLFDRACAMMPAFAEIHGEALAYHAACLAAHLSNRTFRLFCDVGDDGSVIFEPEGDAMAYIGFLGETVRRFTQLGIADPAVEFIDLLTQVLDKAPKETTKGMVEAVADMLQPRAAALEALAGERAFTAMSRLMQNCVRRVIVDGTDNGTWLRVLNLAKGHALSTALVSGSTYAVDQDPEATALLQRIASIDLTTSQDATADPKLEEMRLVAPYLGEQEERPDLGALHGLQHSFDDLVYRRLLGVPARRMIAADQVLDCVPDGAVLLILRELMHDDLKLVITLVTAENTTVVGQPLEQVAELTLLDPALAPVNSLAAATLELRLSIEGNPWPDLVAQPAGTILEGWPRRLGPAEGMLADLRAKGYRRLFVVPDGPLHVFPLHLIGPIGQPLCADWLVSTLPTPLTLAAGACGRTGPRRAGVSAFGIDFADFPLRGGTGTEGCGCRGRGDRRRGAGGPGRHQRSGDPARSRRSVAHPPVGPFGNPRRRLRPRAGFQQLGALARGRRHGRLPIYELVEFDLRGLELVTLSACDTALGRFDVADNLRNIPATLMMLGAKAVISTLWHAETRCAAKFFTSLYRTLAEGRSVDQAFAAAQLATRAEYPDYRDWGCFVLAG